MYSNFIDIILLLVIVIFRQKDGMAVEEVSAEERVKLIRERRESVAASTFACIHMFTMLSLLAEIVCTQTNIGSLL